MELPPEKQNSPHLSVKKKDALLSSFVISVLFTAILYFLGGNIFYSGIIGFCAFFIMFGVTLARAHKNQGYTPDSTPKLDTEQINTVEESARNYIWKNFRTQTIVVASVSILLMILSLIVVMSSWGQTLLKNDSNVLFLLLLPFAIPFLYAIYITNQVQSAFMRQMATTIGFTYTKTGETLTAKGATLQGGHDREIKDLLSGTYQNRQMRIYELSQVVGHGKGSYTEISTVFEIALHAEVPHIALRPTGSAESSVYDSREVTLEGDFNKYFSLQIPKGFDSEIRVIFTPDIMQEFIATFRSYRLEVAEDRLFIITGRISSKEHFLRIYELAKTLFTRTIPLIESVGTKIT